ncbi:MAG: hypothetical protein FWE31_05410 [Firmicutes bacterium]|nr:hypothetical protein [Bacillota bacterium]
MAELRKPEIIKRGIKNGDVFDYPQNIIERLRTIRVAGIPGSIFFSMNHLTNNHCHPVAKLASFAFPKGTVSVVQAQINSIRISEARGDYGYFTKEDAASGHSYLRTNASYILDTTRTDICTEEVYNELEQPSVIKEKTPFTDDNLGTFHDSYLKMLSNPELDDTELTAAFMPYILNILCRINYPRKKENLIIDEFDRYAKQIKYDEVKERIQSNPSSLAKYATEDDYYGVTIPSDILPYCADPSRLVTNNEELFRLILDNKTTLLSRIMLTLQKTNMRKQASKDGVSYNLGS